MDTPQLVCPDCRQRFEPELADTADLIADIRCPHCRAARSFSEYLIVVRCPACAGEVAIPVSRPPDAEFRCPACGKSFSPASLPDERDPDSGRERLLADGDIFDKYRIVRLLGRGGMSEVYLAEHLLLDRRCALKLLLERKNAVYQKRFLREARCVLALDHPNIVKLYDAGCDGATGRLFIAMEYVEGTPLSDPAVGKLDETELLKVASDMTSALAALESAHIVHRDIKPSNIIRDGSGNYKLTDLGIAKTEPGTAGGAGTLTVERAVVGTPAYASPEQCRDAHRADLRSDIYSLGASLYHLASGHPPYRGVTPVETILRVIQSPPEPLEKLRPDLSPPLRGLVDCMLRKAPEQRPQNASELAALIDDVRRGRWRLGRRRVHPVVLTAVGILALLLLALWLFIALTRPAAVPPPKVAPAPVAVPPPTAEVALSPELRREFANYGVEVVVADYASFPSENRLGAADLAADARIVLDEFRRVGVRYLRFADCRRVLFYGRAVRGPLPAGTLALNHRTVRRVRHQLVHRYDPFVNSYRCWRELNAPGFFYLGKLRNRVYSRSAGFEILRAFAVSEAFESGFAASAGTNGEREDFATFADLTAQAGTAAKWRTRARRDPVFKRKWYTAIAVCARSSGYDFWKEMYGFTDDELAEIKQHDVDLERLTGIKFVYAEDLRRQGVQWRTAMVLAGLDRRLIAASGVKRVCFMAKDVSPKPEGGTLTINDDDAHGLVMALFTAVCRRDPERLKQLGISGTPDRTAHLFHRCFFKMHDTAEQMALSADLYAEVVKLRKFTSPFLNDDFWRDLFDRCGWIAADRRFESEFGRLGIELDATLPEGIAGERCNYGEIQCGIRAFKAACSILTPEFVRASGIRRVAFGKKLTRSGRRTPGGCVVGDTLCLNPEVDYLMRKIFYELFLAGERGRPSDPRWLKLNPADFRYRSRYRGAGFVSPLALWSEAQDRADTFALLLWNPCRAFAASRNSAVLRAKIAYIRDSGALNADGIRFVDAYFRAR